jgi:hypothetical protein
MWICDSAVLGLPSISLLLPMPRIVVRRAAIRNIGCRYMQSFRMRAKCLCCICS